MDLNYGHSLIDSISHLYLVLFTNLIQGTMGITSSNIAHSFGVFDDLTTIVGNTHAITSITSGIWEDSAYTMWQTMDGTGYDPDATGDANSAAFETFKQSLLT